MKGIFHSAGCENSASNVIVSVVSVRLNMILGNNMLLPPISQYLDLSFQQHFTLQISQNAMLTAAVVMETVQRGQEAESSVAVRIDGVGTTVVWIQWMTVSLRHVITVLHVQMILTASRVNALNHGQGIPVNHVSWCINS